MTRLGSSKNGMVLKMRDCIILVKCSQEVGTGPSTYPSHLDMDVLSEIYFFVFHARAFRALSASLFVSMISNEGAQYNTYDL